LCGIWSGGSGNLGFEDLGFEDLGFEDLGFEDLGISVRLYSGASDGVGESRVSTALSVSDRRTQIHVNIYNVCIFCTCGCFGGKTGRCDEMGGMGEDELICMLVENSSDLAFSPSSLFSRDRLSRGMNHK
jgi:hypothetical protein